MSEQNQRNSRPDFVTYSEKGNTSTKDSKTWIRFQKWIFVFASVFLFTVSDSVAAYAQTCGDGFIEFPEDCDDGNLLDGDGCSSLCQNEAGFNCPACGDGILSYPEECDDGNTLNGDGCNNGCKNETLLSTFTVDTSDLNGSGGGLGPAIWEISASGYEVTISPASNPEPGVLISPDDVFDNNAILNFGTIVEDGGDDDYVGIVLGYNTGDFENPNADYLIALWKGASQNFTFGGGCSGGNANGLKLVRVQGVVSLNEMWNQNPCTDTAGEVTIVAQSTNYQSVGFNALTDPQLRIAYTDAGRVQVFVDNVLEIDVTDPTFPTTGKYGYFTFAQQGNELSAINGAAGCAELCGDGIQAGVEECDDGNTIDGDGCSSLCQVIGVNCTACGDGSTDGPEECDDGNSVNGDGCSDGCRIEPLLSGFDDDTSGLGGGLQPAIWNVGPSGYDVTISTATNPEPGVFISPNNVFYDGPILNFGTIVEDGGDDDYVGIVLGYEAGDFSNPNSDFLVALWKGSSQNFTFSGGCSGGLANGLNLIRVQGVVSLNELWNQDPCTDTAGEVTIVAESTNLETTGFNALTNPKLRVVYTYGRVQVFVDDVLEIDETDSTFPTSGKYGFYTFAQQGNELSPITVPAGCALDCGDGILSAMEACDDGNNNNNDGCDSLCVVETGFTCDSASPSVCTDIDECALNTDNCDPLVACTNISGSFICGTCPAGYDDVNGDGTSCVNIDECAANTDDCNSNALCTDTPGSFTCSCAAGYTGDGITCVNEDECALNTHNCGPNSTCSDTTGSFICACDLGYTNDGISGCVAGGDFSPRFDQTIKGRLVSASNVLITCEASDPLCSGAQNFIGSVYQNEQFEMVHIDVDGDGSTFNSSSANITFPANSTVVYAGLYWGGQFTDDGEPDKRTAPPNAAAKTSVKFKVPGGNYVTVSGSAAEQNSFYQGFADVTNLVTTDGEYTVADVQLTTGQQMNGGWTLVVIVDAPAEPLRRMVVWDGFLREDGVIGDRAFTLPNTLGNRNAESSIEMTLMTYDGDKGASDSLRLDGTLLVPTNIYPINDPAAAGDISNSTIRYLGVRKDDRNPNFKNTLGYDADVFEIGNLVDTDDDVDMLFRTAGDVIHLGMVAFQSDVNERFIQTDWTSGPSAGSSNLLESETGFLNRTGHVFHDTSAGNLRSVQFSYAYDGDLYEISPVRSDLTDNAYINSWISNPNSTYPAPECNQGQFWIYREVDISRVSWLYGANGTPFNCNGSIDASWSITGAFTFDSLGDQSSATGFNSVWANQSVSAHRFRFSSREFSVDGTMDARAGTPTPEQSTTLDIVGTEVPYNWGAPASWSLASDFDGRLESKVFDGVIPRGFGELTFNYTQTNNSTAVVFFRTGDDEADVLSKAWEGPFIDGDMLGTMTTNDHQFFQYAIETTLVDPAANDEESVLVIQQLYFDMYGIVQ